MVTYEFRLLLNTEKRYPIDALLLQVEADGQLAWVADAEFGPFDGYWDVLQWFAKHAMHTLVRRQE